MLPTGAFAFSSALEAAVQTGVVRNVPTLQQYVTAALRQSSTGDAVGLAFALRALCADPVSAGGAPAEATLARLRNIDLALYRRKLPEEFRDMMTKTGLSFAEAPIRRADGEEEDVLLEEALTVYFYGVAMGILNASLRLMRVTHFDVQAMLYRSSALFEELCRAALSTPLERMTGYAPMTEILSAFHVGARVRLFMS